MKTPQFVAPIKFIFQTAGEKIGHVFVNGKKWVRAKTNIVTQKIQKIWDDIMNIPFMKNTLKPIFERVFKPLKKKDFIVLIGAGAVAAFTIRIAINIFGTAVLPLAGMGGAMLVIGGCLKIHNRIRRERHEIAWHSLERIRCITHVLSLRDKKIERIRHHLKKFISNEQYFHVQEEFEKLNKDLIQLNNSIQKPDFESYKLKSNTLITYLKSHVEGSDSNTKKLNDLNEYIKKAGTDGFEPHKMFELFLPLKKIKPTTDAESFHSSLNLLEKDLDLLQRNLNASCHKNAKNAFKNYAEALQKKLVPDWDPKNLGPNYKLEKDEAEEKEMESVKNTSENDKDKDDIDIDIEEEKTNKDDVEIDIE